MRLNVVSGILISALVFGTVVCCPVSVAAGIDGNPSLLSENEAVSKGEEKVVEAAWGYLFLNGYSRSGLYEKLTADSFLPEEAENAIKYLESERMVDWNEEAVCCAETYLRDRDYTREEMINTLSGEGGAGFSHDQAVYAADYLELKSIAEWKQE